MIIEDEPNELNALLQYDGIIEIVAAVNSSFEGIELTKQYMPDVVVLDLELNKGSGNGLLFLKSLSELPVKKPYILVTTNNISHITNEQVRKMGADFIMNKHQPDYSAGNVIEFLLIMKDTILNIPEPVILKNNFSVHDENLEKRMAEELDKLGMSPKLKGRRYIIEAVKIVSENRYQFSEEIARKYKKSQASVERAIQNAIKITWNKSDINDLFENYTAKIDPSKDYPTMNEFIFYYAQKLKN